MELAVLAIQRGDEDGVRHDDRADSVHQGGRKPLGIEDRVGQHGEARECREQSHPVTERILLGVPKQRGRQPVRDGSGHSEVAQRQAAGFCRLDVEDAEDGPVAQQRHGDLADHRGFAGHIVGVVADIPHEDGASRPIDPSDDPSIGRDPIGHHVVPTLGAEAQSVTVSQVQREESVGQARSQGRRAPRRGQAGPAPVRPAGGRPSRSRARPRPPAALP